MKKNVIFSAALALFLVACSSDDSNDAPSSSSSNEPITIETVANALTIQGASEETGTPPTPNGDLTFTSNTSIANVDQGFFIEINSDTDVDGVYLQLLDENNTPVAGYYDIPASSFSDQDFTAPTFNTPNQKQQKDDEENTDVIDVNFSSTIPAGTFCYLICVYDEETGFVSAPTEVCVTVNDWGGDTSFAGTWINDSNFEDTCIDYSDPSIGGLVLPCENGSEVVFTNEVCLDFDNSLVIESSGDFRYNISLDYDFIDVEASSASCSIVNTNLSLSYAYVGRWSYDAASDTFTMVLFSFAITDGENTEETSLTPIAGNEGILFYSGSATVSANQLILDGDDTFFSGNYRR